MKNLTDTNASLLNRFKAFTTDSFMILMPLMYLVFYVVMGSGDEFSKNKALGWIYIFVPHMIAVISFWYFRQQTPGLKAYELSIVNSTCNEKPKILFLILRYVFTTISIILILPLFVPFTNKNKRTFQDILSKTHIKNTPNKK